ncbi:hypothetical protein [Pseudomonas aeruginosa]|uniref:hypothetical protein n=1 Tax=Pseudomonas aeruginosa TaxID=287 RepID=UPI001CD7A6F2|nr:hypothetical protein [Pseudomonas aeruginosa]
MDSQLKQWRDEQKHLPEFMRDFHNCKELFKGISDYIVLDDDHPAKGVNWMQAHCYTIDVFLWFMARHGWTLQRSRARQNFDDLYVLLEELNRLRREAFTNTLPEPPQDA